jgi:glycosyltransferase involved in cell wall biosynthesis
MAMGVPVIAARRGILPELVADGERGLLVDDTPENLARAILTLARQETRRRTMGERAREYARNHFALSRQADIVGQIYRELAERGML